MQMFISRSKLSVMPRLKAPQRREQLIEVASKLFAKTLHGATIHVKDYPGVLLDMRFDDKGDLDRESFLVKVVNGKQQVVATLPPVSPIK